MLILEFLMGHNSRRLFSRAGALLVCLVALPSMCYAAAVTGTVRNKTTNKPDAGDDVVLIALTQRMEEVAHAKTDADGRYSIELPDPGMHLIRVDHEKAAYFAPVPAGTTQADVDVYDVEPKVEGVTTEADMRRVETDQQGLHVIESYFVNNQSSPPRTQFSSKTYEIYLPKGAQIEASIAMGPGGMPVAASPVPAGDKGHYAFVFPVRPGETRFQVSYHLPYSGSYTFQSRVSLPTANLAVVLPKSMTLTAGNAAPFQSLSSENPNTQTFLLKNVQPSQPLRFAVSGSGALPRDAPAAQNNQTQEDSSTAGPAADTRPGIGLGTPIDTPDPLDKYKWWILGGLAIILVVAAAFLLRSRETSSPADPTAETGPPTPPPAATAQSVWLNALKEELFALETERLEDKLSEIEYREQKAAFETVLRRALTRHSSSGSQKDSEKAGVAVS